MNMKDAMQNALGFIDEVPSIKGERTCYLVSNAAKNGYSEVLIPASDQEKKNGMRKPAHRQVVNNNNIYFG